MREKRNCATIKIIELTRQVVIISFSAGSSGKGFCLKLLKLHHLVRSIIKAGELYDIALLGERQSAMLYT